MNLDLYWYFIILLSVCVGGGVEGGTEHIGQCDGIG